MSHDAATVVRRFLSAEFDRDVEGMLAELADDVVFELPNAFAGMERRYEGKAVVEPMLRGWIPSWWSKLRSTRMDIRVEADPERVVAEYASEGTVAANGKPYVQSYAGMFTVRGGKIVYHAEYFNPLPIMHGLDMI